jgi:hypothetical protein
MTHIKEHIGDLGFLTKEIRVPQKTVAERLGSIFVEPEDDRLLEIVEVGSFAADAGNILSPHEIEEMKQELACLRQLAGC